MTERKHTEFGERGFAKYGDGKCSYGINWRVAESSAVGDPRAFVFVRGVLTGGGTEQERTQDGALHLTVEQVTALRDALQCFLDDAADPGNWRNDPSYVAAWREPEE